MDFIEKSNNIRNIPLFEKGKKGRKLKAGLDERFFCAKLGENSMEKIDSERLYF